MSILHWSKSQDAMNMVRHSSVTPESCQAQEIYRALSLSSAKLASSKKSNKEKISRGSEADSKREQWVRDWLNSNSSGAR